MTDKSNRKEYLSDSEIEPVSELYDQYVVAHGDNFKFETRPLSEKGRKAVRRKYWIAIFAAGLFTVVGIGTIYYIFNTQDYRVQMWVATGIYFFLPLLLYREANTWKRQTECYHVTGIVTNKFTSDNRGYPTYYIILSRQQEIKVFEKDYDILHPGDILDMECVDFSDPSLPRETKNLGNIITK
jgi:hypothetical protein